MRKVFLLALLAGIGLIAVESASSFVLFRYFERSHRSFRPQRSATLMLLDKVIEKANGKRHAALSADHGPVFETDATLGFVFVPGRYLIKEESTHQPTHMFELTVTPDGRRATSNFPIHSAKRIFVAGASTLLGWGLEDEETIPWLMQAHLPQYEVVNLTLTSYSTIDTLMQLQRITPSLGADDIVILEYRQDTNQMNVMSPGILDTLSDGLEVSLGDPARMRDMKLPFGSVDAQGKLSIHRVNLSCSAGTDCSRPAFDPAAAAIVTEKAIDEIIAMHPGHLVIALLSSQDGDAVLQYLRTRDVTIADLRPGANFPLEEDIIETDSHLGPFAEHQLSMRLLEVLSETTDRRLSRR